MSPYEREMQSPVGYKSDAEPALPPGGVVAPLPPGGARVLLDVALRGVELALMRGVESNWEASSSCWVQSDPRAQPGAERESQLHTKSSGCSQRLSNPCLSPQTRRESNTSAFKKAVLES